MKKELLIVSAALLALFACSPVLNREFLDQGARNVPFSRLRETPELFQGKLFILGGVIVETRFVEKGSQVEALSVPVDSFGYLKDAGRSDGRFLAVYSSTKGLLDPLVYKRGREITLAGEFVEARKGKIDEMEYVYPVFEIREVHLWEERRDAYWPAYYYPYEPFFYPSPFLYDPWGRPYPNAYWPYAPR